MARESNPIEIRADYSKRDWREDEAQQLAKLRENLRSVKVGDLVGETLRWQRADSYAVYVITAEKPFTIAHLIIGDAWQVERALVRGLRLSDARGMVERERAIALMFKEARGE